MKYFEFDAYNNVENIRLQVLLASDSVLRFEKCNEG